MAQGWAGANAPTPVLSCAVCIIREDRSVPAVTQVKGTMVCLKHAKNLFADEGEQW